MHNYVTDGAKVNKRDECGDTPLFNAVEHNKRDVVALLLERGADPNKPNREKHFAHKYKLRPLEIAIRNSK